MAGIKNIAVGQLNLDESVQHMPEGDYPDARNMVFGSPISGDKTRAEKIIGTHALTPIAGTTVTKIIGACAHPSDDSVYLFALTSTGTGNAILRKDVDDVTTLIADYYFGWFSGTEILNCFITSEKLIWVTDSGVVSTEIMCYPLGVYPSVPTAGSLDATEIGLAKKPPLMAPVIVGEVVDTTEHDDPLDADYQFAYYFEYIDNSRTVLSPVSKVLPRSTLMLDIGGYYKYTNFKIYCDIPTGDVEGGSTLNAEFKRDGGQDTIPQNVTAIVMCGKRLRSSTWIEIGKIKRLVDVTTNNGYDKFEADFIDFKDKLTGTVVPSSQYSTQYFVPRDPKSMVFADNKVFVSNFHEGKAFPGTTIELNARSEEARPYLDAKHPGVAKTEILKMDEYTVQWNVTSERYERTKKLPEATYSKWVVLDTTHATPGYYDTDFNAGSYTPGDVVTIGSLIDLSGTGDQNKSTPFTRYYSDPDGRTSNVKTNLTSWAWQLQVDSAYREMGACNGPKSSAMSFTSQATYKVGIVYSDDFGRKSDAHVFDQSVTFPAETLMAGGIDYELNIEKLDIPVWAQSVDVLLSKNTKKSFVLQGRASHTAYKKLDADGAPYWSGSTSSYEGDNLGLGISIEGLVRQGHGYEFQEGDRLRLFSLERGDTDVVTNDIIDRAITGQEGYYVYIAGEDYTGVGIVNPWQDYAIEIYRETQGDQDSIVYGNGQTHILTSDVRNTLKGTLSGDLFIELRPKYDPVDVGGGVPGVERSTDAVNSMLESTMSLDDDGVWFAPRGKAYFKTEFGEIYKDDYFRWGANIINDTKINGLGEFLALDEVALGSEFGAVNSAVLVGDNQSKGSVILALTAKKAISLYIKNVSNVHADGTSSMVQSTSEIGLIRPHEEPNGTIHPASVFQRAGKVYFYDYYNGAFCKYGNNGIKEISADKVSTFFKDFALKTSKVRCGYYDAYDLLFVTVENGGTGNQDETISYNAIKGMWSSFQDVVPDIYYESQGRMYMHEGVGSYRTAKITDLSLPNIPYSTWTSATPDAKMSLVFNQSPDEPKIWGVLSMTIGQEGIHWTGGIQALKDTGLTVTLSSENGQSTNILASEFTIQDGVAYAPILYDVNSTGGIASGDEMSSNQIRVDFNLENQDPALKTIQIGIVELQCEPVSGHIL
jgi:hypothetical protein